jgi:hypothetical protein
LAEHASRLIAELIGEAVVTAIERSQARGAQRVKAAWRWVRETTEAPVGLELVAPDGCLYTGVIIVERSRALYVIALRHASSGRTRHEESPFYHDEQEQLWRDRNGCAFRR